MGTKILYLCATFLIFRLIASAAPPPLAAALSPEDCAPAVCGGLNITYPFWLDGVQSSDCGYPTFNITCSKNKTSLLILSGHDFYVKDIFYHNQSLRLSAAEFVDDPCQLPYYNLTYDSYPLSRSASNKQVVFFFNCSISPENKTKYEHVTCARYGRPAYYGGEYDASSQPPSRDCGAAIVPVMGYTNTSTHANYSVALTNGWLMNWTVQDCTECSSSGGTCGYNSSWASFACFCSDRVHRKSCVADVKSSSKRSNIEIALPIAFGIIILALLAIFGIYEKKKKYSGPSKFLMQDPEMSSVNFQTHVFSYSELQEATNFFDASREIGDGGFGTVYKGELRDGRIVAIKRLYENSYKRVEQFMNEVEILSKLHHPNLVNLYGCTSQHSRELLLVYEFVSNGTVADHLNGSRASDALLTWPMRLNIAIEIADALRYLHAVEPPIIHRDIKTDNILLDSNFHVKVADFGLSRLFPNNVTHVSTIPQGTPGYVDPEYHQCYQLTDKSDVYSFGVVLAELISSKPAVDITRQRSEINLSNFAVNRIQNGEIDQLVDPNLDYHSNRAVRKMITMVAELAFRCLQTDGEMRPPIKEVLDVLRAIEIEGYKAEKKQDDIVPQDDAGLLQNAPPLSPDTVMHEWLSRSTTPYTSQ